MEHGRIDVTADPVGRRLWIVAVLSFGVGDLASTLAGLGAGAVEANPIVSVAIHHYHLVAMVTLKLVVLGACYAVWHRGRGGLRAGIPIGLAAVGAAATGWNLAVLSVLS